MMPMPEFQERHHDYVLGPNQDARLASLAAGALIKGIKLTLDSDAPFVLRSRAVRQTYTSTITQEGLQFLKARWAGPTTDYRQQALIPQTVEMVNYGQYGNPKPVFPNVVFPASGVITLDVENTGSAAIEGLTFYWRGVKLYPWGSVPGYTYPDRMAGLAYWYKQEVFDLGVSELRENIIFTVQPDADFVMRGGLCTAPFSTGGRTFAEVFIKLKDFSKKPFSNDFVHLNVLFGSGGFPSSIPIGTTPSLIAPFGTGPSQPGLFYPEIYVPKDNQLLFDLQRSDGAVGSNEPEDFNITWVGGKVFKR